MNVDIFLVWAKLPNKDKKLVPRGGFLSMESAEEFVELMKEHDGLKEWIITQEEVLDPNNEEGL